MVITDRHDAAAALAWLVSVGADEAIADEPVDRFRAVEKAATFPPPPSLPPQGEGTRFDDVVGGEPSPSAKNALLPGEAQWPPSAAGGGWGGSGNAAESANIPL